jgi:hypothetical protein
MQISLLMLPPQRPTAEKWDRITESIVMFKLPTAILLIESNNYHLIQIDMDYPVYPQYQNIAGIFDYLCRYWAVSHV